MFPPLHLLVMVVQKDKYAPSILRPKSFFFSRENFLAIKGNIVGQTKGVPRPPASEW